MEACARVEQPGSMKRKASTRGRTAMRGSPFEDVDPLNSLSMMGAHEKSNQLIKKSELVELLFLLSK